MNNKFAFFAYTFGSILLFACCALTFLSSLSKMSEWGGGESLTLSVFILALAMFAHSESVRFEGKLGLPEESDEDDIREAEINELASEFERLSETEGNEPLRVSRMHFSEWAAILRDSEDSDG